MRIGGMLHSMNDTQIYIGAPNGIVLCADKKNGHNIRGRFYHSYSRDYVPFENADQLLFGMELFFDSIRFPFPSTKTRSFADLVKNGYNKTKAQARIRLCSKSRTMKKEKVMKDRELLDRHGDIGSFIIRVNQRKNSSMQGRLTWVEKNKTVSFRSAWEMIRLIDSALEMDNPAQEDDLPAWEDED